MSTLAGTDERRTGLGFSIYPYLQLMRPANLPTAAADVLAGFCVAASASMWALVLLSLSTVCLYAGGVVLNDAADADLDAKERPNRPIPRGAVQRRHAYGLAFALFGSGVAFASLHGVMSGVIALAITILAAAYDLVSKRMPFEGFYFMAGCRALNILLGLSAVPVMIEKYWWIAVFHFLYVSTLTLVSQAEVYGGRSVLSAIAAVMTVICGVGVWTVGDTSIWGYCILLLFTLFSASGFVSAAIDSSAANIRHAVKRAVIGIILLNAIYCAQSAQPALLVLCLAYLPLSFVLSRTFEVT